MRPLRRLAPRRLGAVVASVAGALFLADRPHAGAASGDPTPAELAIWNDPEFRAQFARSYAAETDIEPKVTADELKQMQRVLEHLGANDLDKAAEHLRRRRNNASSAVYDFTLGNIHFQRDELAEAASEYEAAVRKFPRFRRAWRNLGLVRAKQEDLPAAMTALGRVVELGGGDATTYGLLGYASSSVGDELAAETAYRMAILLDPHTLDWKMGLARSLFRQRRFADASALVELLMAQNPDRGELWLLQANAFLGLNQPMRAAENYELVDSLGQSTMESLAMLGDIYVNEEIFELAVDRYLRAMAMQPPMPLERAMRAAKAITARGAVEQTERLLDAIESAHGSALGQEDRKDLLRLRARLALARDAASEEARLLEEVVALDPLDGEALILLGRHHAEKGDLERGIFFFERAAMIERFEAEAKLRHAQALVKASRFDEAIPLLRRSLELAPRENVQRYLEQVQRQGRSGSR
ncbi:MAG TPA: tetratricopeptide repeat protein [Phycisphaerales bacterium]|nr:tetratricopeptide repeat protein [Phycisphaerales bacterium]HMP38148.1 tetratricopeptide repeat protein [Phycisphaerales bacterium]